MTLGQYATAVGAAPRWVQNARAILKLRDRYDEATARILGLARALSDAAGIPLLRAYDFARSALAAWPTTREWAHSNADSSVRIVIDIERYLSTFNTRLSLARAAYAERTRGPRRTRRRDPVAAASEYGYDVSLIDESAKLTPAARLRRLDQMAEFFRATRAARERK
jgi:hypothetical protein